MNWPLLNKLDYHPKLRGPGILIETESHALSNSKTTQLGDKIHATEEQNFTLVKCLISKSVNQNTTFLSKISPQC